MARIGLFAFIAACAPAIMALPSAGGPMAPLASALEPPVSSLQLVATKKAAPKKNAPSKKKYKGTPPPTSETPYCPYGKKSDGSCWVRCKYVICL